MGAFAPPVPFGSGQGPQPLLGDDTRRKNYAALSNYGKSSIILRKAKRAQEIHPQIVQITT